MARPYTNLDLDVLRTFVQGVDLGSFGKAAERLSRSPSAVSTQLKKLEAQLGVPLLRRSGRGLVLTEAGESLLVYARRLLELNDEAVASMGGIGIEGSIRLGLQEDFAEGVLPDVLGRFVRAHPRVRVEARVARNAELFHGVATGTLDLAVTWGTEARSAWSEHVADVPMRWIGPKATQNVARDEDGALGLVVFGAPCLFRTAGTAALNAEEMKWRVTFTSPSLGGLWAAVSAGLGVTPRTPLGLSRGVRELDASRLGLPALPSVALTLHRSELRPSAAVVRLTAIVRETLLALAGRPSEDGIGGPSFADENDTA